jgi:hypothetical protein
VLKPGAFKLWDPSEFNLYSPPPHPENLPGQGGVVAIFVEIRGDEHQLRAELDGDEARR